MFLSWRSYQDVIAFFGNINRYENVIRQVIIGLGLSASPLWCVCKTTIETCNPVMATRRAIEGLAGGHNLRKWFLPNMLWPRIRQRQACSVG